MASSGPATPNVLKVDPTSKDSPGNWQHPKLDEINARLRATTFGESNVKTIAVNLAALTGFIFLPSFLSSLIPAIDNISQSLRPYPQYLLFVLRIVPILFILAACLPLLRPKDDLSDIALTPSQRALFGLGPASRPATPGSVYSTPPKYSRSATPRSAGSNSSMSPLVGSSGRNSPMGASMYSPSPLFQRAVNRDVSRRLSYGSPSPLGISRSVNESTLSLNGTSNTPSPSAPRASLGLSSRWIYEKGKDSPSPVRRSNFV